MTSNGIGDIRKAKALIELSELEIDAKLRLKYLTDARAQIEARITETIRRLPNYNQGYD